MRLNDLRPPEGARKKPKRVGRGEGSGWGKTSGRGHKGQRSRTSGGVPPGFEGGQMPMQRRLPKRGFTNAPFKCKPAIINLRDLNRFEAGSHIDPDGLAAAGIIRKAVDKVKLLGQGTVDRAVTVSVHQVSASARSAVEAAGGKVQLLTAGSAPRTQAPAPEAQTQAPEAEVKE
jgi:large subunit ribosomal protein L15